MYRHFLTFTILTIIHLLCLQNISAQQQNPKYLLPSDAVKRIGKGFLYDLEYSPDGSKLAVATTLGIWIYDTTNGNELNLLTGHTRDVISVCFNSDGRILASGSYDDTIRLWDMDTGKFIRKFSGHNSSVYTVAFSLDDRIIVSGSRDEMIKFWDVETGNLNKTIAAHVDGVYDVRYAPNGEILASYGVDEKINLWNPKTGEFINTLIPKYQPILVGSTGIEAITFSPDNTTLVSVNTNGTIRVWDLNNLSISKTFETIQSEVYAVRFSPDGQTLAINGPPNNENTIQIWDISTGNQITTLNGHTDRVASLEFSTDGNSLASYSYDNTLQIWDVKTGTQIQTITGHNNGTIRSIMYSSDGKTVASFTHRGIMQVWDAKTYSLISTTKVDFQSFRCVDYSPDNMTFAFGYNNGKIEITDRTSGEKTHTIKHAHTRIVTSVAFSDNASILASGGYDKMVRLWDVSTGKLIDTLAGHQYAVLKVEFSPSGDILVSGGSNGNIYYWDLKTGNPIRTIAVHTDRIENISFSKTGDKLVSSDADDIIRLWDVSTGSLLKTITPNRNTYSVKISPDGNTLASSHLRAVILWNVSTGELINMATGHSRAIYGLAFSPDGKTLISGSHDHTMIVRKINPSNTR